MTKLEHAKSAAAQVDLPRDPCAARRRDLLTERMLPWMSRMVLALTLFFFLASAAQLAYLHFEIVNAPRADFSLPLQMLQKAQDSVGGADGTAALAGESLPAAAVASLTMLEVTAMERRYHQANVSLLSRVWTRYLGFVTGMVLAMVGAVFILGRLETSTSSASGKAANVEFDFKSESPGLIMVGLGVALMVTTIVIHHKIHIQDRPIYAQGWSIGNADRTDGSWIPSAPPELGTREPEPETSDDQGVAPNPDLDPVLRQLEERRGQEAPGDTSQPGPGSSLTR